MSVNILVIGHGRHGKDTFAAVLCELLPYLKFTSSSAFFAEYLYYRDLFHEYESVEECYADRVNRRELWRDAMAKYNEKDPSKLAQDILEVSNVYVGMRTKREFEAAKSLFNYIFYVDAMPRLHYIDSTFEIMYDKKTMILIDNNKDFQHLQWQAKIASEIINNRTNLIL